MNSDRIYADLVESKANFLVAEPQQEYLMSSLQQQWVEVLVDFPGIQGLYTYSVQAPMVVKAGDIVSVPFGMQMVGGIAIRLVDKIPEDVDPQRIRPIEDVITSGFFPDHYWELLQKLADYYLSDLMSAVRVALPPGLLGRSQRRIRLKSQSLPSGAEVFCSVIGKQVLELLQRSKDGHYSVNYLRNQIHGADRGIRELIKRGWVESYLESPRRVQAKLQKAVTLVAKEFLEDLTSRQTEVLKILRNHGGEIWLSELTKVAGTSPNTLKKIAEKGYIIISEREVLRKEQGIAQQADQAKKLSSYQASALAIINQQTGYAQLLLHGVTGSGKTEVYLQAIAPMLAQGQSALVLVPEIGLTPQLTDRFRARFGEQVCVYHSKLSDGERYDTWRQTIQGEPQVVIGTRSAIFAPLPNLGLIILDEEHDSSFKQDRPIPTYHARTVANWRAELSDCPLILGSATPSLESLVTSQKPEKSAHYLSLPERIGSRSLPPVEIVDMREELNQGNRSIFSKSLQKALSDIQTKKQQGILFIPRRGHSTFVSCRSCGYVIECPHCDVSLSYHYIHEGAAKLLRCHYCNFTSVQPDACPECSSPYLKHFGSGTQRVTQELTKLFPDLSFIRFDSDTTRNKNAHRDLIASFTNKEKDILVGTQMLTKGLDIAGVTLVGVVSADGLLHRSDYRAAERAFQTLTQVAGRAGRGDKPGKVIIQTYSPEHSVIQAVKSHDYSSFSQRELAQRAALSYPPYGKLIVIKLSGVEEEEVRICAENIADECLNLLDEDWELLGPAPATIMRVARRYRWQILLKFPEVSRPDLPSLNQLKSLCPKGVAMTIDVDPISMD
ncbi:replication restart DNA helicase PriA [Xenococcus sp. PCC 7305]|nr:primosomal protein N' [Xenococcus sp. PCC 7305]ELS02013.1 replication restart DNA helicase PriA [Xenococcus sp. PCC 7305]